MENDVILMANGREQVPRTFTILKLATFVLKPNFWITREKRRAAFLASSSLKQKNTVWFVLQSLKSNIQYRIIIIKYTKLNFPIVTHYLYYVVAKLCIT